MSIFAEKTFTPEDLPTLPKDVLPGFQIRVAKIFPGKTAGKPEAGS
jgi:hypothetical protein